MQRSSSDTLCRTARSEASIADAFLRDAFSLRSYASGSIGALSLALLLSFSSVRRALDLQSELPRLLFLAWPAAYALTLLATRRSLRTKATALLALHGTAMMAAAGVCAVHGPSATTALVLLLPVCWARMVPYDRAVIVGLLAIPAALRALAVPSASPSSLVRCAVLGLATSTAFVLMSLRLRRTRSAASRDRAREMFGAESVEEAAALSAAMKLHDGLSGATALAAVIARSGTDEEVLSAGRRLLAIVQIVRAGLRAEDDDPVVALRRFAAELDVSLALEIAGDLDGPRVREATSVMTEILANHARHGGGGALSIRASRSGPRTMVHVRPPLPTATSAHGRGLRWLATRTTFRAENGGTKLMLGDELGWLDGVELAFYLSVPLIALLVFRALVPTLLVSVPTLLLFALHVHHGRRFVEAERRSRAALRTSVEVLAAAPLERARSTVDALATALSSAVASESRDGLRELLPVAARDVSRAIDSLALS